MSYTIVPQIFALSSVIDDSTLSVCHSQALDNYYMIELQQQSP